MATKSTYKKRVISESDDSDEDVPLAATASAGTLAVSNDMKKSGSHESNHNPETIADGSTLLKEAGGDANGKQHKGLHLEDAEARHDIVASGFPTDVEASSATAHHPLQDNGASTNGNGKMNVDGDESSDDDKPIAAKVNGTGAPPALPSFKKKGEKKEKNKKKPVAVKKEDEDVDMASTSDDDRPLASVSKASSATNGNGKKSSENSELSAAESSDEDVPLAKKANGKGKKEASDDEDSDDAPLAKKANKKPASKKAANGKGKKRAKKDSDDEEGSDFEDEDKPKKPAKKRVKKEKSETPSNASKALKKKIKKEDSDADSGAGTSKGGKKGKQKAKEEDASQAGDDDEEEHKWWLEQGDDGPKWKTLEHAGVLFAPPYVPLPKTVKLKYEGKPVDLPPEAEEVAGFYAALLETDHAKDITFQKNFYRDFCKVLDEHPPRNKVRIDQTHETGFPKFDFRDMLNYFEAEKAKKKELSKEEKKRNKEEKDAMEKKYITCLVDGRTEKLGNFRLEPPGLFRGRGEHPKKGTLKYRLEAEDITINIGKEAPVPEPPAGHKWAKVQHDNNVTWLATWKENVNGNTKYVFLAAGSSWKGQSDLKKFEKARGLKGIIDNIRKDYEADLTSKEMLVRQRATAVYFIDRYALRVGGAKDDDEADTVGCCSLRYEHVTLREPNLVTFDFLGKDSIRFYQPDKEVTPQVFKNLKLFKKGGKEGEDIFDRIKPQVLNEYFGSFMKGLSAKVFRTYNASYLLQLQLKTTPEDASVADKILHYNRANRLVAELCNHQRAAAKNHGQSMEKLADKVKGLKYQRMKLRYTLWAVDDGNKKKHKEYKDVESDLDNDWMEKHEVDLVEKEKAKIKKKFEKDNEKRVAEGEKELTEKELEELLEGADEMGEQIKMERVDKKVEPKKTQTTAKILDALIKIDQRIDTQKIQAVDKEEGKEISLTTSKINYMDPRVTVAWCKKHEVPLEKMFSKTLRTKFTWAMDVDADWEF